MIKRKVINIFLPVQHLIDNATPGIYKSVCLLQTRTGFKVRMVGLQHPDLPPAVDEEHDGGNPESQNHYKDSSLLGTN